MAYKARLVTTISDPVDRRLRLFALLRRQPLSRALSALLDEALPSADELVGELRESEATR